MSGRTQSVEWLNAKIDLLELREEMLRKTLEGASHALRSYQYGNDSPAFAQQIADHIDALLAAAPEAKP